MKSSNDPSVLIIMQARLESSRLPNKVVKPIVGAPLILWQLDRLRFVNTDYKLVVACPNTFGTHTILAPLLKNHGYNVSVPQKVKITGCERQVVTEDNVLARYAATAVEYLTEDAKTIPVVRLTGDCPLFDPEVIDQAIQLYFDSSWVDYVALDKTWPDGLDIEVFSLEALLSCYQQATTKSDLEHVTPYIWKHPGIFRQELLPCPFDLSSHCWSVDSEADLHAVERIIATLVSEVGFDFAWRDVWMAIEQDNAFHEWSTNRVRNQGYLKSIQADSGETENTELPPGGAWENIRYGDESTNQDIT